MKKINRQILASLMLAATLAMPLATMATEGTSRVPVKERILQYATAQGFDKFVSAMQKYEDFAYIQYLIIGLSENAQKLRTEISAFRENFQANGGFSFRQ